jgi:hypothetical protein
MARSTSRQPKPPRNSAPPIEEIEGLSDPADEGLGEYPIDTLLIRTEVRTVFEMVRRIDSGAVIMNPDFQRDFVWDSKKQSRLIESVLMRIPLPVFYLAETRKGEVIVVDGLQRLSTFQSFLRKKTRLVLPKHNLDTKTFEDLDVKLQNRIEDCQLQLYLIDSKVPERAKLDIFERVNNGEPLTRQQMRNCLYSGKATRFLQQQAATKLFLEATGHSLNQQRMRDREFVNRFCAFRLLSIDDYKNDMDAFLAKSLELMNTLADDELQKLEQALERGLRNNHLLFERHAFRKHHPGREDRSVINASLWDVMSTILADYPTELVTERASEARIALYDLLKRDAFDSAITYSPNSTRSVRTRFELAKDRYAEVFHAAVC